MTLIDLFLRIFSYFLEHCSGAKGDFFVGTNFDIDIIIVADPGWVGSVRIFCRIRFQDRHPNDADPQHWKSFFYVQ